MSSIWRSAPITLKMDKQVTVCAYRIYNIYTINLLDAVTLDGAYDGRKVSPVGPYGHMICCSGR